MTLRIDKGIVYGGLFSAALYPVAYAMEVTERRNRDRAAQNAAGLPDSNAFVTDSQESGGTMAGQTTGRTL